jgi:hypothetical protein
MELIVADKLENIIRVLNFKDSEAEKTEDLLLGKYLKYVHVLGQLEAKVIKENSLSEINNLFYNRYYWFNQFKERSFALFGHDEGLEQQSFKMLSDYNEQFPENIDWGIIEQIENGSILTERPPTR